MKDIFPERDFKYNLREYAGFKIKNVYTVRYGTDTISYLGPKIWNLLPDYMKEVQNLETFKKDIKHFEYHKIVPANYANFMYLQ